MKKRKNIELIAILVVLLAACLFAACDGGAMEELWKDELGNGSGRGGDDPVTVRCTVTFVSNGGSEVASQTIVKGTCALKSQDPTFGENTFSGWFLKGSSEEFNFSTPITEDITLYAHWKGLVETKSLKKTIDLSVGDTIEVAISPVSTSPTSPTSVKIPANAISKEGSSSSELAITSYSIEVSTTAFAIVDQSSVNNLAVAGIDCTLKIDDEIVSDFNEPVVVTTYIPKGLNSVQVVYKGDDGKSQPIADDTSATNIAKVFTSDSEMGDKLGYSKESGKLRFKTEHFSEFYVATNAEVCIVNDSDETDISAMTLGEFRDDVNIGNTYSGKTVTLLKDVDLKNVVNWVSISTSGSYDSSFAGTFDGNYKTISNMKTNNGNLNGSLFGSVTGVLKNLTIKDAVVVNGRGTLATLGARGIQIINCHLINCAVNTNNSTGLLLGYVDEVDNALIKDCTIDSSSSVTSSGGAQAGGIVGQVCSGINTKKVTITGCVNNGSISGSNSAGGIVGQLGSGVEEAIISECTNNGIITLTTTNNAKYVGGIVGYRNCGDTTSGFTTITDCTNTGTVTSSLGGASLGGFMGYTNGVRIAFVNCISSGSTGVEGAENTSGFIANYNGGGPVSFDNCRLIGSLIGGTKKGNFIGYGDGPRTINPNCSPSTNDIE